MIVTLALVGAAACGDDAPSDGGAEEGFDCGMERCAFDVEACVVRTFAPAACEPRVGDGLEGIMRCRAHVDAYCGGSGERCDEGSDDGGVLPDGAYRVLCL